MNRFILVLAFTLPAAADVFFGAARPVSEARQGLNAWRSTSTTLPPIVTAGDGLFLVTWTDHRAAVPKPAKEPGAASGAAIRVDATGRLLDQAAFALPVVPRAVVWTGEQWIALNDFGYARITRDGKVLDAAMQRFDDRILTISLQPLFAAWTGGALVVASHSPGTDEKAPGIYARTFDRDMTPIAEHLLLETRSIGYVYGAAGDGNSALVVYSDRADERGFPLYGARFARDGALIASNVIGGATRYFPAALGVSPAGYMLVTRAAVPGALYRALLIGHGNTLVHELPTFGLPSQEPQLLSPTLPWDGSAFTFFTLLATPGTNTTALYATRIDPGARAAGVMTGVMPWQYYRFPDVAIPPVAAVEDGMTLLVSPEYIPSIGGERLLARAAADPIHLGAAEAKDLIIGAQPQETAAAASSAAASLIVWREKTRHAHPDSSRFDVLAARVLDDGTVLDPSSIAVGNESCYETPPAVASDGRDFLVAWGVADYVQTRKVAADGTPGIALPVITLENCDAAKALKMVLASNGSNYLLVWVERRDTALRILAKRIDADGYELDSRPIFLKATQDLGVFPRVAADGVDYVVAAGDQLVQVRGSDGLTRYDMTLTGDARIEGIYWNGSAYTAWARYGWQYDTSRKLTIARDLSSPSVHDPLPEAFKHPYDIPRPKTFACRNGSCVAPHEEALVRIDADGSVSFPELGLVPETRLETVMTGVSNPLLVYVARPNEQPLGGVARVLLRPMLTPRGRAVRK
ncbi:MAG TPA: hypothetical protein VEU30_04570 [Thermoanaerobaculia bacterium]|nr:hypothetical protein [Thermoanaerobaculia bacterium]